MAPKKTVSEPESERAVIAKTIRQVESIAKNLSDTVAAWTTWTAEQLHSLDQSITEKKQEIAQLDNEFMTQRRKHEVELNLYMREKEREAAIKVLSEVGEIAVSKTKYEELLRNLETASASKDAELEKLRKEMQSEKHAAITEVSTRLELKHKAEFAVSEATSKQLDNQIGVLQKTIDSLREEVDKQRELTKSVANASAKSQITQTFEKR